MNRISSTYKIIPICAMGIILNMAGASLAKYLHLPIFLDTYGTFFIAALGGYVPGITVGFLTNLIGNWYEEEDMYFGLVSILLAMITTFLYQRGYYKTLPKIFLTTLITVFVATFLGTVIEELIFISEPFESLNKFWSHYRGNLMTEFPDKGLAILFTFAMMKIFPSDLKNEFAALGKKQAPIPSEMQRKLRAESKFIDSLRTKMIFNLIAITLIVAISISAISYAIYHKSAVEERTRIADGIISMVVSEINPNRVDEFLELGHKAEGYNEVERNLYRIRASNSDIKFIYVYKIMEDGCHVVFDLDTATVDASKPGSIEEFDEAFLPYLPDLLAGRPIPPLPSNETYGNLLTIYKPVYNNVGKCVCYAGIDFSMDKITDYGRTFISKVVAVFAGALIFIFVLGLTFIENNIILPVNTMAFCAKNFAYDSEEAREQNIDNIKSLDIKTNDEIENLYSAFVKMTSDSMHYFNNLRKAKIEVAVMEELAHKDAMTGIKNKTSYGETIAKLDGKILTGDAQFCIIMIDVNYLKRVNDTYGHERGNEYLINACNLTCDIFGKEDVYRVGGDEFVVVLDGEKVPTCAENVARLRATIEKFRADDSLEAWEKVSAAIGVAYYEAGVDKSADDVFKRADADMYQNKLAMKATRRD